MICFCFIHAFERLFFISNFAVFVGGDAKIFLFRGAGYPSYATELYIVALQEGIHPWVQALKAQQHLQ